MMLTLADVISYSSKFYVEIKVDKSIEISGSIFKSNETIKRLEEEFDASKEPLKMFKEWIQRE